MQVKTASAPQYRASSQLGVTRRQLVTSVAIAVGSIATHSSLLAQSQQPGTAQDDPALAKCRQIIKEWTLRDSRRSVDEDGRPLR